MWILNGCTMDTFINYPWLYNKNRVRKYLETHKFIPNTYIYNTKCHACVHVITVLI